jgi:PTH1 family peptidyl-tRNA hydrolase
LKLIVGLGNPGKEYELTRHNVGFMVIDHFCSDNSININSREFNSFFVKIKIGNEEVILCKPLTYMNNSGICVKSICDYYKIKINDILIVSDDLNVRTGAMRFRVSGSSGGQNGLKSIIDQLGSENFRRLRVGISKPENDSFAIHEYVMSRFKKEEQVFLKNAIHNASNFISDFIHGTMDEKLMSKYNSK